LLIAKQQWSGAFQSTIINQQLTMARAPYGIPIPMTNRTRTDTLLLAGFCAFLFFYGLNQFGLIGADEPRYAQVAREMLQRHDWITPVLDGRPWLEKPPLYYWQAMLAYSFIGVSDWAARLPSAIDATLLVLAVYFFLRRFRPGFELDGALITASSVGIVGYARAASMDMALTTTFAVAMLAWWAWRESQKKIHLAVFYGLMALGMLAKGPVAPFLAALIVVLYAAIEKELRLLFRTLWLPGIVLFCALALPWYIAVQMRNPQFFREFILEHNLARFSRDLYHHSEPFWYYAPVTALALLPWTAFIIAAVVMTVRSWRAKLQQREATQTNLDPHFQIFACCWLILPVAFFAFSQSKLPGYILPAIPAGGLLLAEYLRHLNSGEVKRPPGILVVLHAVVAAALMVPALLIAYLVTQHRLPHGRPLLISLTVAFILFAGIALTLLRTTGLRMLRFVTLIPLILTVGAVMKLGSLSLDQSLSARPVALEIAGMETHPQLLAVYHVRRELEYGLTFYRNRETFNYGWGSVPAQEHLLVAPENSQLDIAKLLPGRRVSYLGHYAPQRLDYFWVSAAPSVPQLPSTH
jgi:4-amino-4-deoxy-L-arabinose transferase-like glycosyltransferase